MLIPHPEDVKINGKNIGLHLAGLGHLFPFSALLLELSARGHEIHLRTLSTGVEMGRKRVSPPTSSIRESRRSSTMTGRLRTPAVR